MNLRFTIPVFFLIAGQPMLLPQRSQAQSYEIQQLVLDFSKLTQLKNILSDMYKGYQVLSQGYSSIRDIAQGNFNLHKAFLDGLLLVSPAVRNDYRVSAIIAGQSALVNEYQAAYSRFRRDKHFSPDEILYMGNVYGSLVQKSLNDLDDLINILSAGVLRMSDDERLSAIARLYTASTEKLNFLRQFNSTATVLAAQRAADLNDAGTLSSLYGLP